MMSEWLWLFNLVGTAKVDRLIEVMTYARRRYNCRHFLVDSLVKCGVPEEDYNAQKVLVERLCDFCYQFSVHVHLVAHARKGRDEYSPPNKLDVKGTGSITDLASNVFTVWRNKSKEEAVRNNEHHYDHAPDAMIACSKQRNGSWEGQIRLSFDIEGLSYHNHR